jgi:hypothetical protein
MQCIRRLKEIVMGFKNAFSFAALLLVSASILPARASLHPATHCDQTLAQRPTSQAKNILLEPGAWIPKAPDGWVYLSTGPIAGGSLRYGYELTRANVQVQVGPDGKPQSPLPRLPAGYEAIFRLSTGVNSVDLYEIVLTHPFPKAGNEAKALSVEENKMVRGEIGRVALLLTKSLLTRAMPVDGIPLVQKDLDASQLIRTNLVEDTRHLATELYEARLKIRSNSQDIVRFLNERLPLRHHLIPSWPNPRPQPPKRP